MVNFEDLTPEQRAMVRSCETPEQLLALAEEECCDLTDEQLEGISGGWDPCISHDPRHYELCTYVSGVSGS